MSETSNVSAEPAAVGSAPVETSSVDPNWEAAVAEASAQSEPVAEPAAPVIEDTGAPAEPAVAEDQNADYHYAKLENGEHEIRLSAANGGEVFRGKTELEVAQKMAASKAEANRYIQQLKSAPSPAASPTATMAQQLPEQVDPTSLALADLIAPLFGLKSGMDLAQSFKELQQGRKEFQQTTAEMQAQVTAQNFFASTPDFVATKTNNERLGDAFDKTGLPFTAENLKLVHYSLKGQGLYENAPQSGPTLVQPRGLNGQFAPTNPLPPTGNAPSAAIGKTEPTLADLEGMSQEDLKKWLDGNAA